MILIKNNIKKIKIDSKSIKQDLTKMLTLLGYQDFDIGIWFTTNKTIKNYNHLYRNKNKATDILSFPYHTELKEGEKIKIKGEEDKNLGDIIISLEFAKSDAKKTDRSLKEHLQILLAHGVAHLIGYDHITDKQYYKMQKIEQKLLKSLLS